MAASQSLYALYVERRPHRASGLLPANIFSNAVDRVPTGCYLEIVSG
jgi:hypothetical protein